MTVAPDNEGWDCHAHVFGPYDRYPLTANRVQTPPEAPEAAYLGMLDRLGLARGVLVHTSMHGDDHSQLHDMLAAHPQLRGVMVPNAATASFAGLRDQGIRAARFSHRPGLDFPGAPTMDDLERLAPALADAGLHAEMWSMTSALPDIASRIAKLPVPLVLDHMGSFRLDDGIDAPGFKALRDLLASGRVWVKMAVYRNLVGVGAGVADAERGRPFHEALLAANPEQLVWGSDWPHLRIDPTPDPLDLLNLFKRWTPDAALQRRVLVDNPNRLYA